MKAGIYMAYSFSGRVRYSEIGENGLLTLPGVLNYFQDCSTFQSEEVGLGMEVLKELDHPTLDIGEALKACEKILGIIRMAGDRGPLSVSGRRNHHFDLGVWISEFPGNA